MGPWHWPHFSKAHAFAAATNQSLSLPTWATTSLPSRAMATTGPLMMYSTRPESGWEGVSKGEAGEQNARSLGMA